MSILRRVIAETLTLLCLVIVVVILLRVELPGIETEWRGRSETYEGYVRRAICLDGFSAVILADRDGVALTQGKFPHGHYQQRTTNLFRPERPVERWFLRGDTPWMAERPWLMWDGHWRPKQGDYDFLGFALRKADSSRTSIMARADYRIRSGTLRLNLREPSQRWREPEPIDLPMAYRGEISKLAIPLWPVLILAAIYPALRIVGVARRNRRVAAGRCPRCAYDMRVTPGRCPECGWEAKSGSSP
jgi:hypothetical protein